jgi:hypothetical protein
VSNNQHDEGQTEKNIAPGKLQGIKAYALNVEEQRVAADESKPETLRAARVKKPSLKCFASTIGLTE